MACLQKRVRKNGDVAWSIQFRLNTCKKSLFLPPRYTEKEAMKILGVVEETAASIETGATLDPRTYAWLLNMTQDLRSRFEAASLIEPENKLTLEQLFDRYEREEVKEMKPTTARNKRQAARTFLSFADGKTNVCEFTHAKALEYAAYLAKTRSEATKAGYIRDVRRVFNWGRERELIDVNPFDNIARGSFKNKSRERYITRQEYEAMLDAAMNQEARVLIAFYRIGGLRYGEALLVRWRDVDFNRKRLLVHSPKTERIKGRDTRLIPLFPELRRELEGLKGTGAVDPDEFVILTHRTTPRKVVNYAVVKAGLEPWERLVQNLRSSRAIEIYQEYGVIAESEWIGHSERTAKDHYLHLLESDFDRATIDKTSAKQDSDETLGKK